MMKYSALALLLLGSLTNAMDDEHDHEHEGGDHDHAEDLISTKVDIYDEADYHQQLEYFVEVDELGQNWLVFESTLEGETGTFANGNYISQWYQLLCNDCDHHGHAHGDHGHDHRALEMATYGIEGEAYHLETVQATVLFDANQADIAIPAANASLQQSCGEKLHETWVDTDYAARLDAEDTCQPWITVPEGWTSELEAFEVEVSFKRKFEETQLSEIKMAPGQEYTVRGGFHIQKSASVVTGQTIGYTEDVVVILADGALQGLAAGIMALSASLLF